MRFIIVQVSKERFVIAEETSIETYQTITKKIGTRWEAGKIRGEIAELEPKNYSELTTNLLFDTHEELG